MKEATIWIGYNRPEYAKVSLESIYLLNNDKPENLYAYVNFDGSERNLDVIKLLKDRGAIITLQNRDSNSGTFEIAKNVLSAYEDFFSRGYDICHYVEEDIILSKDYFRKARLSLANENISMFCGCIMDDSQFSKIYSRFSTLGVSFKRDFFYIVKLYLDDYWKAYSIGKSHEYQKEKFGSGEVEGFDGLFANVFTKHKLLSESPERSYSKDIGSYGYHQLKGIPPVKTLEEWANEPVTERWGYGINGLNFKL